MTQQTMQEGQTFEIGQTNKRMKNFMSEQEVVNNKIDRIIVKL